MTSCSNGSDDNDDVKEETSVRLKGNFFISDDANAEWVYCEDKLAEKENGIWEGEITAVKGYDNFGVEVNGTWYGAKEGLEGSVTDAELIKDSQKNFWLATDKDGKSKVTVNLNEMTITVEAVNNSSNGNTGNDGNTSGGNNDNDETETPPETDKTLVKDLAYTADGNLIEVCPAEKLTSISPKSITISVANVSGTGDWWCSYDANGGDWTSIKENWDESIKGYKKTITDSAEISYFKENGIKIGMLTGLTATVTVTWE